MKIFKLSVSVFVSLLFICSVVYAAPAGNPSDTKAPYGNGALKLKDSIGTVKISADGESIIEHKLEGASDVTKAEMGGEWYLLRVGYPLFGDILEPYAKVGISDLEVSWTENSTPVTVKKGNSEVVWGAGMRFLACEIPKYKIKFIIDGQYRSTNLDVDNVTIDNISRTVSTSDFKISEWQAGAIVSLEFALRKQTRGRADVFSLIPYIGVAYSDCDVEGKFTYSGTAYDIGDAESDKKIVLITGCDLKTPLPNASLNVEGRLIGETSVSGGATIKF